MADDTDGIDLENFEESDEEDFEDNKEDDFDFDENNLQTDGEKRRPLYQRFCIGLLYYITCNFCKSCRAADDNKDGDEKNKDDAKSKKQGGFFSPQDIWDGWTMENYVNADKEWRSGDGSSRGEWSKDTDSQLWLSDNEIDTEFQDERHKTAVNRYKEEILADMSEKIIWSDSLKSPYIKWKKMRKLVHEKLPDILTNKDKTSFSTVKESFETWVKEHYIKGRSVMMLHPRWIFDQADPHIRRTVGLVMRGQVLKINVSTIRYLDEPRYRFIRAHVNYWEESGLFPAYDSAGFLNREGSQATGWVDLVDIEQAFLYAVPLHRMKIIEGTGVLLKSRSRWFNPSRQKERMQWMEEVRELLTDGVSGDRKGVKAGDRIVAFEETFNPLNKGTILRVRPTDSKNRDKIPKVIVQYDKDGWDPKCQFELPLYDSYVRPYKDYIRSDHFEKLALEALGGASKLSVAKYVSNFCKDPTLAALINNIPYLGKEKHDPEHDDDEDKLDGYQILSFLNTRLPNSTDKDVISHPQLRSTIKKFMEVDVRKKETLLKLSLSSLQIDEKELSRIMIAMTPEGGEESYDFEKQHHPFSIEVRASLQWPNRGGFRAIPGVLRENVEIAENGRRVIFVEGVEVDRKQLRKRRLVGNIGDGLGKIGDGLGKIGDGLGKIGDGLGKKKKKKNQIKYKYKRRVAIEVPLTGSQRRSRSSSSSKDESDGEGKNRKQHDKKRREELVFESDHLGGLKWDLQQARKEAPTVLVELRFLDREGEEIKHGLGVIPVGKLPYLAHSAEEKKVFVYIRDDSKKFCELALNVMLGIQVFPQEGRTADVDDYRTQWSQIWKLPDLYALVPNTGRSEKVLPSSLRLRGDLSSKVKTVKLEEIKTSLKKLGYQFISGEEILWDYEFIGDCNNGIRDIFPNDIPEGFDERAYMENHIVATNVHLLFLTENRIERIIRLCDIANANVCVAGRSKLKYEIASMRFEHLSPNMFQRKKSDIVRNQVYVLKIAQRKRSPDETGYRFEKKAVTLALSPSRQSKHRKKKKEKGITIQQLRWRKFVHFGGSLGTTQFAVFIERFLRLHCRFTSYKLRLSSYTHRMLGGRGEGRPSREPNEGYDEEELTDNSDTLSRQQHHLIPSHHSCCYFPGFVVTIRIIDVFLPPSSLAWMRHRRREERKLSGGIEGDDDDDDEDENIMKEGAQSDTGGGGGGGPAKVTPPPRVSVALNDGEQYQTAFFNAEGRVFELRRRKMMTAKAMGNIHHKYDDNDYGDDDGNADHDDSSEKHSSSEDGERPRPRYSKRARRNKRESRAKEKELQRARRKGGAIVPLSCDLEGFLTSDEEVEIKRDVTAAAAAASSSSDGTIYEQKGGGCDDGENTASEKRPKSDHKERKNEQVALEEAFKRHRRRQMRYPMRSIHRIHKERKLILKKRNARSHHSSSSPVSRRRPLQQQQKRIKGSSGYAEIRGDGDSAAGQSVNVTPLREVETVADRRFRLIFGEERLEQLKKAENDRRNQVRKGAADGFLQFRFKETNEEKDEKDKRPKLSVAPRFRANDSNLFFLLKSHELRIYQEESKRANRLRLLASYPPHGKKRSRLHAGEAHAADFSQHVDVRRAFLKRRLRNKWDKISEDYDIKHNKRKSSNSYNNNDVRRMRMEKMRREKTIRDLPYRYVLDQELKFQISKPSELLQYTQLRVITERGEALGSIWVINKELVLRSGLNGIGDENAAYTLMMQGQSGEGGAKNGSSSSGGFIRIQVKATVNNGLTGKREGGHLLPDSMIHDSGDGNDEEEEEERKYTLFSHFSGYWERHIDDPFHEAAAQKFLGISSLFMRQIPSLSKWGARLSTTHDTPSGIEAIVAAGKGEKGGEQGGGGGVDSGVAGDGGKEAQILRINLQNISTVNGVAWRIILNCHSAYGDSWNARFDVRRDEAKPVTVLLKNGTVAVKRLWIPHSSSSSPSSSQSPESTLRKSNAVFMVNTSYENGRETVERFSLSTDGKRLNHDLTIKASSIPTMNYTYHRMVGGARMGMGKRAKDIQREKIQRIRFVEEKSFWVQICKFTTGILPKGTRAKKDEAAAVSNYRKLQSMMLDIDYGNGWETVRSIETPHRIAYNLIPRLHPSLQHNVVFKLRLKEKGKDKEEYRAVVDILWEAASAYTVEKYKSCPLYSISKTKRTIVGEVQVSVVLATNVEKDALLDCLTTATRRVFSHPPVSPMRELGEEVCYSGKSEWRSEMRRHQRDLSRNMSKMWHSVTPHHGIASLDLRSESRLLKLNRLSNENISSFQRMRRKRRTKHRLALREQLYNDHLKEEISSLSSYQSRPRHASGNYEF